MSLLSIPRRVIQLRLVTAKGNPLPTGSDKMNFIFSQVLFSGALNSLNSTSISYQQLGYGDISSIMKLQALTIDINPSEDVLYLLVEPEHLDYIVTVFYDFFCHARFLALNSRAVENFTTIQSRIPNLTLTLEPLFSKLEELFAVFSPETGDKCEGVIGFAKMDTITLL